MTLDIVQSGSALTISNVLFPGPAASAGSGEGIIDPVTGVFDAGYGYYVLLEPIGTVLNATASPDGLSFTGQGTVTIVVGSAQIYQGAMVGVRLTGQPPVCGNSQHEFREECEDGNTADGDGCSAACVREPRCGDRIRDPGEDCDDGNTTSGDGCSATCVREPRCGDGVVDPGEQCDDGNSNEADACSSTCLALNCGNSVVDPGERCDDGNTVNGDCCSATCQFTDLVCRPSTGRCDPEESCRLGMCPADQDNGDADGDNICDYDDMCQDIDLARGFLAGSRLNLTKVNDGVSANERFMLRAVFEVPASTPLLSFDPRFQTTFIRLIPEPGGTLIDAALPPEEYAGPGTRGWSAHGSRQRWMWRDKTPAPIEDLIAVRISVTPTATGELVVVRVIGRAREGSFGIPTDVIAPSLPIQASITMGASYHGRLGRCGQSRFTAADCSFERDQTRVACK